MTVYHVGIESRPTASETESVNVTVVYEAPTYHDAWVGARTVCRLGTLFKDDPKCKAPSQAREFFSLDDNEPFHVGPAQWTVRKIFVSGTRKRGRQRMTVISAEDLIKVIANRKIDISDELKQVLQATLTESAEGGLRITHATARRLGLVEDDEAPVTSPPEQLPPPVAVAPKTKRVRKSAAK